MANDITDSISTLQQQLVDQALKVVNPQVMAVNAFANSILVKSQSDALIQLVTKVAPVEGVDRHDQYLECLREVLVARVQYFTDAEAAKPKIVSAGRH